MKTSLIEKYPNFSLFSIPVLIWGKMSNLSLQKKVAMVMKKAGTKGQIMLILFLVALFIILFVLVFFN